jgi:hypothetical protein
VAASPDVGHATNVSAIFGLWSDSSVGTFDSGGAFTQTFVDVPVWLIQLPGQTVETDGLKPQTITTNVYWLVRDSDGKVLAKFVG